MAQVSRLQQRLEALFGQLSGGGPAGDGSVAGAEAAAGPRAGGGGKGAPMGGGGGGGQGRKQPTPREQELLDTVALLKSALERTKKGLESGVSNSKYMAVRWAAAAAAAAYCGADEAVAGQWRALRCAILHGTA